MENTPKSKFIGFKGKYQDNEKHYSPFDSSPSRKCISMKDITDLETQPISEDVLKTPPIRTRSNLYNGVCRTRMSQDSPQFRVGWNDGSQKNDCDMISPISALPIPRRIRRCPDSFLCKVSKNISAVPEDKIEKENETAILRCIDWAKNLIDCASPEKENFSLSINNITEIAGPTADIDVDILDDSTNEAMILCSQAVEESVPCSDVPLIRSKNTRNKHFITPENNSRAKRIRSECVPDSSKSENTNRALNVISMSSHSSREKLTSCASITKKSKGNEFRTTNEIHNDKHTIVNCNNNNDEKSNNYNYKDNILNCENGNKTIKNSSSRNVQKILNTSRLSSKISNLSVSNHDPIKSQLDEDDDEFCSLDFNIVDTLEHSVCVQSTQPPVPKFNLTATISAPLRTVPESKPLPKYTKEQIERRRMEAKKRLLLNRKHKSI